MMAYMPLSLPTLALVFETIILCKRGRKVNK
jgi:hypothetical protein